MDEVAADFPRMVFDYLAHLDFISASDDSNWTLEAVTSDRAWTVGDRRRATSVKIDAAVLAADYSRLLLDARTYRHLDGLGDVEAVTQLLGEYLEEAFISAPRGVEELRYFDLFFRRSRSLGITS
jgi:hypothetical protein